MLTIISINLDKHRNAETVVLTTHILFISGVRADKKAADYVIPQVMVSVKEHREKIDRKHPEDFIDRFLIYGMDEEEKGNHTHIFSGRHVWYCSAY